MSNDYRHSVLVIEDSDEDYDMIREGLAESGVTDRIERLTDVMAARRWLDHADSRACLVMLDLNLPGGSGRELVKSIKTHDTHKTTPVVVFSTSSNPHDLEACYTNGANSYHVKPLETPFFHEMVKHIAQYWFNHAVTLGNSA